MPAIAELITGAIKPLADLFTSAHFSGEERAAAQLKLVELQTQILGVVTQSAEKELDAKAAIIVAEAKGESWLQRSWRPIVMLDFAFLISASVLAPYLGFPALVLPAQMWPLLSLGIGGYVIGRSAEKALPATAEAVSKILVGGLKK